MQQSNTRGGAAQNNNYHTQSASQVKHFGPKNESGTGGNKTGGYHGYYSKDGNRMGQNQMRSHNNSGKMGHGQKYMGQGKSGKNNFA